MIRFTYIADEHTKVPNYLLDKSEMTQTHRYTKEWERRLYNEEGYNYRVYASYACIETDEINNNDEIEEFCIAVMDYKPKRSKRTEYIFSEPLWHFIQEERTPEQQKFIDRNFDKLNNLYIEYAKSQGYLERVK